MTGFGKFERSIARGLEKFPLLRNIIKESYKRLTYPLCRQSGFACELHPEAKIVSPEQWAGLAEHEGECFFGYYDKPPWIKDMNQAVFHRLKSDRLEIIVADQRNRKEYAMGTTRTWNWQQGAMTQWVPGTDKKKIIYNTAEDNVLGSRIINLDGSENRFVKWPIQALKPDGKRALTLNYKRLMKYRPDYGYSVGVNNFSPDLPLNEDGIWQVDLNQETAELIIPIAWLAAFKPVPEMKDAAHWVNHIIYSPSGERFVFLHRFLGTSGRFSRLYCAKFDGSDIKLLMDERMVSHYHWRDDNHVLVWGRSASAGDRYYLIDVDSGMLDVVGEGTLDRFGDGHCSYSPDRKWVVTDTYPDRARQRMLILFNIVTGSATQIGRFFSAWKFDDVRRCDLHPRFSHDGKWISIDSVHEGIRKTYFVDINRIIS